MRMVRVRVTRRSRLGVALAAAVLGASLGAGAVMAGEITGNGEVVEAQGQSICKFSGLNDDPNAEFPEGGRTQSYGQLVRMGFKDFVDDVLGLSPGYACNPTSGFHE